MDHEEYFKVVDGHVRPYVYKDQVHFLLRYETSLHLIQGERVVYGILDFAGDVGGFLEAAFLIIGLVVFLI